jgi:hypothetical protein
MYARLEGRRPALVLLEDDLLDETPAPAFWQDLVVSLALALLLGLALVI